MAVIWTGRDPLEIAQLEASLRNALASAELASRENMFEMAQRYKEQSPENQLALAKMKMWESMAPEEQKETMGVKSPVEREMQKAQLAYAQQRPGLEERETAVKEEQMKRLADQFSQDYKVAQEELQLKKDAFQAKRDEFITTTYNKNKQDFLKRMSDLGANKEEVSAGMNAFLMQTVNSIQDPRISSDTAFGIGADAAYSIIDMMKKGKLPPEQVATLRQNLKLIDETMRKRAIENPSLAPSYQSFKMLSSAALQSTSSKGYSPGWMEGTAAGLGGWYGYKYLRNKFGNKSTSVPKPSVGSQGELFDMSQYSKTNPKGSFLGSLKNIVKRFPGFKSINPVSTGLGAYFLSRDQGEAMPGYSPFSELAHGRTEYNPENPFGEVY